MASKAEIGEIVAMLSAAYPRYQPTTETLKTYTLLLQDIPGDELQTAAIKCAASSPFFPSVNELRSAVGEIRRKANGVPSVYEAWEEVETKPRYMDGYAYVGVKEENGENVIEKYKITWSHPIVEKVARQLGWPKLFPSDNIGVDRAHFFKAYDYAMTEAVSDDIELPQVRGYIEGRSGQLKDLLPKGGNDGI